MTNGHHIILSLSSLHYWFESLPQRRRLEQLLSSVSRPGLELDGVEIPLSFDDLFSVSRSEHPGDRGVFALADGITAQLLELPNNSAHLEDLQNLPASRDEAFCRALAEAGDRLGVSEFTVHPTGVPVSRWERLGAMLPGSVKLSIENMDIRKQEFRSLGEMSRLLDAVPALRCTFDIAHWLEHGRRSDSPELMEFLARYSGRVSKIHFSVPASRTGTYKRRLHPTSHFCASWSGTEISSEFFSAVPSADWIIEGLIPVEGELLLREEIALLRSLTSTESALHWQAA